MKKTTRLSAVVLMLALCMNLFVSALATTEGIPIEDLDVSAYQMLLTASSEEETHSKNGAMNEDFEYSTGVDCPYLNVSVPAETFAEDYTLNVAQIDLNEEEKTAIEEFGAYETLASFDVEFLSQSDGETVLETKNDATFKLVFNVDVSEVEGNMISVLRFLSDGTVGYHDPEYVLKINPDESTFTLEIDSKNSATYVVATEVWSFIGDDASVSEDIFQIGFLDKKNNSEIPFLSEVGRVYYVPVNECPDCLILWEQHKDEAGNILLYTWEPFESSFWDTEAGYCVDIEAQYFTNIVEPNELYATVTDSDGSDKVKFYPSAYADEEDYKEVTVSELITKEFPVLALEDASYMDWFIQVDNGDDTYNWISYENLGNLSTTSSLIPEIEVPEWDETSDSVNLECGFGSMPENTVYTWQSFNGAEWADVYTANTPEFSIAKSEDDVTALAAVYRCVAKDADGNVLETSAEQCVVSDEFSAWILNDEGITVSLTMLNRAYAVSEKEGVTNALEMLHVENTELVSVYTGAAIADFVEFTDLVDYTYRLVDRSMGLTVAYVDADGNVVSVDDVVIPDPETTDEPIEE